MAISPECLSYLKQNLNDFAVTEVANVARARLQSTEQGQALLKGAKAIQDAVSNPNRELNSMISGMTAEARKAITSQLVAQMSKLQGTKKGNVLSTVLLTAQQLESGGVDTRGMITGIVNHVGIEQLEDTSTIKDRAIRELIETSLSSSCLGTTTVGNLGAFYSTNTSDLGVAEEGLDIMRDVLTSTPLSQDAFQDPTFMAGLENDALDFSKTGADALNKTIVDQGLDLGFSDLTTGITNTLPSNAAAALQGKILPVTKSTVTNCLVGMADVRKSEPTIPILADSKIKMEEAIISLKAEGSLVRTETVVARMTYLNGGQIPAGLTENSTRVVMPTVLDCIEKREDVLDKFPSIPAEDGYQLLEQSVTREIKSPFQVQKHAIDDVDNPSEDALRQSLDRQVKSSTISNDKPTDLANDDAVIESIEEAKSSYDKAEKLNKMLSYVPQPTSNTTTSYTKMTYENERSAAIS